MAPATALGKSATERRKIASIEIESTVAKREREGERDKERRDGTSIGSS